MKHSVLNIKEYLSAARLVMRMAMGLAFTVFLLWRISYAAVPGTFQAAVGGNLNDEAKAVRQNADGSYMVAGYTKSFGSGGADAMLVKLNSSGFILWSNTFGGNQDDQAYCVQITADGGYILVGTTQSYGNGNSDVYVLKVDANGAAEWSRAIGGSNEEEGRSVVQAPDGGYYITGYTKTYGPANNNVYLIRLDAAGSVLWTRVYGGNSIDEGNAVDNVAAGGCVVAGLTNSDGSGASDIYVLRVDDAGNLLWNLIIGASSNDKGYAIRETSDNNFVITGLSTQLFAGASEEAFLMKISAAGAIMWAKTYASVSGSSNEEGYDVWETTDGGFSVAGRSLSGGVFSYDMFMIRTNANGNMLWVRTFGAAGQDEAFSVRQTSDNGYVLAGKSVGFGSGGADWYVVKIDSLGDCECFQNPATPVEADVAPATASAVTISSGGTAVSLAVPSVAVPVVFVSICGLLPVGINDFDGLWQEAGNVLSWSTSAELNSDYFAVERSRDGEHFEKIAEVDASGSSSVPVSYRLTDEKPYRGSNYYRLRQVDFDGSYEYSKVVKVNTGTGTAVFNIYPNPAGTGDNIYVSIDGVEDEELLLVLYNPLGTIIYSRLLVRENAGDVFSTAVDPSGKLTPGVYLVIGSSRNEMYRENIVIR